MDKDELVVEWVHRCKVYVMYVWIIERDFFYFIY